MGLRRTITTDEKGIKIYRKERQGAKGTWVSYSTQVSTKKADGSWQNDFVDVVFKKGLPEVGNKAVITSTNIFEVRDDYKSENNHCYVPKYIICDFDVISEGEALVDKSQADMGFVNVLDGIDDLPMPFAAPTR